MVALHTFRALLGHKKGGCLLQVAGGCSLQVQINVNSRWPPKMVGKPFLGKIARGVCRYPGGIKFRDLSDLVHDFRNFNALKIILKIHTKIIKVHPGLILTQGNLVVAYYIHAR